MFDKRHVTGSLFVYFLTLFAISSVSSLALAIERSAAGAPISSEYKRLATHCYINDYTAWLDRQETLRLLLKVAKVLGIPIENSNELQKEMEQIRLQHECLRVIERLPVAVGPG